MPWLSESGRFLVIPCVCTLLLGPSYQSIPLLIPCLQALSYLNAKCSDNYMHALVSNSLFAHVSLGLAPAGPMLRRGATFGSG